MADKKDDFDEEFDFDDDFSSFDDAEDYQFEHDDADDADDVGAFDFADDEEEEQEKALEPVSQTTESHDEAYQFEESQDTEDAEDFEDLDIESSEGGIKELISKAFNYINELKEKDPKKLLIYGGAVCVIALLAVFLVIKSFSSAPVNTAATAKFKPKTEQQFTSLNTTPSITQATKTTQVIQRQSQPETLQAPVESQVSTSLQMDEQAKKAISTLTQQNQQLTQQVQALQAQVAQMSSNYNNLMQQIQTDDSRITNIEKSINNVESQMSKVSDALQTIVNAAVSGGVGMEQQMGAYQPRPQAQGARTVYQASPSTRGNSYFIQAIIPGRAWLQDTEGRTITVTYGDSIPGLGKVTKIDPENGVVVTSAGIKIMYGINEG